MKDSIASHYLGEERCQASLVDFSYFGNPEDSMIDQTALPLFFIAAWGVKLHNDA